MRNTWDLDIVWVREMGLEVYAQAILSSLAILAVAVDAENDFGEETSVQKGKIALVYLRNKQVSKNCVNRSVFKPVSFFFLILKLFSSNWFFFNQLSHIFPVEEALSTAERRKCWFCDCRNRGKNIEGIWDSRSCHKFQNSQRLQEKDFSPSFSVQESVKKWGRV